MRRNEPRARLSRQTSRIDVGTTPALSSPLGLVQVGRAHFESRNKRYTILDAPGHKNYVPNMIAGACQAAASVAPPRAQSKAPTDGYRRMSEFL